MKQLSAPLALLGVAFVYAFGVLYFYRTLEDSPYIFNLGITAPAGIHPDWGNRLSVCWDGIVIAALITLFAVINYLLVLLVSLVRQEDLSPSVFRFAFRFALPWAWLALGSLIVILGLMIAWGLLARQDAPMLFEHAGSAVPYLTMSSWRVLVSCLALAFLGALSVIALHTRANR
jgi:hypothetical protein